MALYISGTWGARLSALLEHVHWDELDDDDLRLMEYLIESEQKQPRFPLDQVINDWADFFDCKVKPNEEEKLFTLRVMTPDELLGRHAYHLKKHLGKEVLSVQDLIAYYQTLDGAYWDYPVEELQHTRDEGLTVVLVTDGKDSRLFEIDDQEDQEVDIDLANDELQLEFEMEKAKEVQVESADEVDPDIACVYPDLRIVEDDNLIRKWILKEPVNMSDLANGLLRIMIDDCGYLGAAVCLAELEYTPKEIRSLGFDLESYGDNPILGYEKYLKQWFEDHSGVGFEGMQPACFSEWLDNEGQLEPVESTEEVLRGYDIQSNGMHSGYKELKDIYEVAAFICSSQNDKTITDDLDRLLIKTFGSFIDYIWDEDYRQRLIPIMQAIVQEQYKDGE